jgi:hypothetical protein
MVGGTALTATPLHFGDVGRRSRLAGEITVDTLAEARDHTGPGGVIAVMALGEIGSGALCVIGGAACRRSSEIGRSKITQM